MGGEFFEGPASYLIGGNLLVRWNFVQGPNPKWVPYIQIGGGSLYHDADTDAQDVLGSNVEAMAVGGLGLRYHLNEKWAVRRGGHLSSYFQRQHDGTQPRAEFGRRPTRRKLFLPLKSPTSFLAS